jgi:hypothetical protein
MKRNKLIRSNDSEYNGELRDARRASLMDVFYFIAKYL